MSNAKDPRAQAVAKLLVVDDDEVMRRTLARALRHAGHAVTEVGSGKEALAAVTSAVFDVICSDISMPELTGLELLRAIRERDLDLPVILVTGAPSIETATEALQYGAIDYLVKPVDTARLEQAVSRAAALGRLARAKREAIGQIEQGVHGAGDRAGLEVSFDSALRSLWVAYQPIVRGDGSRYGHEALLRCREPSMPHPGAVLDAAEKLGRLKELGRRIRSLSAVPVAADVETGALFVNLHPHDLFDEELTAKDSPLAAIADRVVLEITERAAIDRFDNLQARIAEIRGLGYRIAIDDLGAGYAGLTSFALLEPDVVKIDMSLVRGVDGSRTKQRLVHSLTAVSHDLGTLVVAEGVETEAELETLIQSGCDLFQGYLLARPGPAFPAYAWPRTH